VLAAIAIAGAIADRRASEPFDDADSLGVTTRAGTLAPSSDSGRQATATGAGPALSPKPRVDRPVRPVAPRPVSRATPALTHADSLALCTSPSASAQRACLYATLAETDAELNRVYSALVSELRRRSGAPTLTTPPEVTRLRTAQRAWIVARDTECRRRTRASEGPLWAPIRARCLGELSTQRARELASELGKLRTDGN
jgi:uncharacterized protein YecT (DUF1311 family)